MSEKEKRLKKMERKRRRKNVGLGLAALGAAGFAVYLFRRERIMDNLLPEVTKRVLEYPKADALYTVCALRRVPDYPYYLGGIPVGGGPDYDERSTTELHVLQTRGTFSTKYKPIFFQTDNPKYVTWKDEFPLNKIPKEVEEAFPDRKRFEVKKNTKPIYYCPNHLLASDVPHALARCIVNAEVGHNKNFLIGSASVLGLGIAIFML
ncbi:transmembrane domain-containing protein [Noumeavirus]|uniref:transmembrane domain-containing protein n=1 Tax=Noumeavirus TaxID=1955558 RepID=UPI000982D3EE|nr:transmembrane domain-containing protein [Noumeavirus]AQM73091.1 transmembrane domain-containing protein [Noumeavirus]